tara:strand:+ start:398 stop:649 length:252 start_codon:yes stop_codon:yes gene_type:complete
MTHYEYGLTWGEFGGSNELTTCYDCGQQGTGLIIHGWDSIEIDGKDEDVCGCVLVALFDWPEARPEDDEAKENKITKSECESE